MKKLTILPLAAVFMSAGVFADNFNAEESISVEARIRDLISVEYNAGDIVLEDNAVGDLTKAVRLTVRRSGAGQHEDQKLFNLKVSSTAGGNGENFFLRKDGEEKVNMKVDYKNRNRANPRRGTF